MTAEPQAKESPSKGELYRNKIRELRDKGLIDFTNKDNYKTALRQLVIDVNQIFTKAEYISAYQAMRKVSREPTNNNDRTATSESFTAKKGNMQIVVKPKLVSPETRLNEVKENIKKADFAIQARNTILESAPFQMQNMEYYTGLMMLRTTIEGFGLPVADEKKYETLSQTIAYKSIQEGWVYPKWLSDALLLVSAFGVLALPFVNRKKEEKEEPKEKGKKSNEQKDKV